MPREHLGRLFHPLGGPRGRRRPSRQAALAKLEALEGRLVLSSTWIEQGPGPIENLPGVTVSGGSAAGAVEVAAPYPTNPDILFVGAVNGGIWKTTHATASSPSWTPLTDNMPSLAISDLEYSPLDPNTLYASTGSFTSGGTGSGPSVGIYKTTDGGADWTQLGSSVFAGHRLRNVVPTVDGGQVVLAAVRDTATGSDGVWRSTDVGVDWTRVSDTGTGLPAGGVSFLTGDPGNIDRFYAAVPGAGVYRSDDGGLDWAPINTGLTGVTSADRIELAVHNDPANNVIYAATMTNKGHDANIFRSTDQGGSWTAMGAEYLFGGNTQSPIHFAMVDDPTDPNVVFVSGDVYGPEAAVMPRNRPVPGGPTSNMPAGRIPTSTRAT